jgi:hypothetical protein
VEIDADSDIALNFILSKFEQNEHIPRLMFEHFDEYYDYYVLGRGIEPQYDTYTDYHEYFRMIVTGDCYDNNRDNGYITGLSCFRQSCCLSETWKSKLVIGVQSVNVSYLWESPKGVNFTDFTEGMKQNIKSQLLDQGFPTDAKMYFILNDCLKCT